MKKFLIIQTASIGDVILSTPVLEKLHKFYPDSKIDFLLKKENESLLKNHPFLNKILIWDKKQNKYKNLFNIIRKVRADKYDYIINIQRFASSGLITVLSGSKVTIGFNKNPFSFLFTKSVKHIIGTKQHTKHEAERNLELIKDITDNKTYPVNIKLYPSDKDYTYTQQFKHSEYLCISPTSLWWTKQYPEEKWIEFIKEVNIKYKIYLIGSNKDSIACQNIINKSKCPNLQNLSGKLSLLQTAVLMKDAKMNFVNDSAPLHIASAMNAPVTAIFCSTIPKFGFGPLSDNSNIIETKKLLNCRPCGLHGLKKCPEKHFNCAYTIDKKQLLDTIQ